MMGVPFTLFLEARLMAPQRIRHRTNAYQPATVHKPRGYFHDRVQRAGPEHFGIACFDCHRDYSRWMLADFFGNLLLPPQRLPHTRQDLDGATRQLRQAARDHDLRDLLVVIERTGRYHRLVQRALAASGYDIRIIHPFATKQFRQVAHPGDKTDDHDLVAMHRAALNGLALTEPERDEFWMEFLRIVRYRRGLIHQAARLRCQIHNHLDAYLPGFVRCFPDFWKNRCTWPIARHFLSPQAILDLGEEGLARWLRDQHIRFQRRSLPPILDWARQAPQPDVAPANARRLALELEDDRRQKSRQIQALEVELAAHLSRTPYVLMLACPGLNVASIADIAAELGPISHYASAKGITGRAGLRPCRYQSGQVDLAGGPLVRCCNRKLRAALLRGADCLLSCNPHFVELAAGWRQAGEDARRICVKVANRLCRILYQVVAGRQVFCHPQLKERHYILDKLVAFHRAHGSDAASVQRDLEAAAAQLPEAAPAAEAKALREQLKALTSRRAKDPQGLAGILPKVLAGLGVQKVRSKESGAPGPR
jgi:transposase